MCFKLVGDSSGQRWYKIGKKNGKTGINIRIRKIIPSADRVMSVDERMDKLLKKYISQNKMTSLNP